MHVQAVDPIVSHQHSLVYLKTCSIMLNSHVVGLLLRPVSAAAGHAHA